MKQMRSCFMVLAFSCLMSAMAMQSGAAEEVPQEQRVIIKWKDAGAVSAARGVEETRRRFKAASGIGFDSRAVDSKHHVLKFSRALSNKEFEDALQTLRKQPSVQYAVPDERRYVHAAVAPNDTYFTATIGRSGQWYLQSTEASAIDAMDAWGVTQGNANVVVAVLDTGVRFDHPDLSGKLLAGYDFVSGDSGGTFLVANDGDGWDADPSDPGDWVSQADIQNHPGVFPSSRCSTSSSSWHGTRVSGIIGAATNNAAGIAGAGWNTMVLPVRVIGKCGGFDSDIIAAMRWAAGLPVSGVPTNTHPAKVINLSLGSTGSCSAAWQDVIDEVRSLGVVVVASAGNEGGATDSPANCNGVIGAAGLRNQGDKVGYSSLGTAVTIAAPAGNCGTGSTCAYSIDTTYNFGTLDTSTSCPTSSDSSAHCYTTPGANGYTNQAVTNLGTSFSAPLVSGVVALMYAANPHLNPDTVTSRLQTSASAFPTVTGTTCHVPTSSSDLQPSQCNCTTSTCGAGMLNAYQAVQAARRPIVNISGPSTVAVGGTVTLDASSSVAADANALTYAWVLASGTAALNGANQAKVSVTAPTTSGTVVVTLTVTDDIGQTSSQNWTLTVGTGASQTYSIGGVVEDLAGSGLVLHLGSSMGNSDVTITANGAFTFSQKLQSGVAYDVSITTQPANPWQTCEVNSGSGTVGTADIKNIAVTCTTNTYTVGGALSGLSGSGLVLQNNSGDSLGVAQNGSFVFATPLASGTSYNVTVSTNPSNPTQLCTVANGAGTLSNSNISNVTVSCATPVTTSSSNSTKSSSEGGGGGGAMDLQLFLLALLMTGKRRVRTDCR